MVCRGEKRVKFQDEDNGAEEDDSGEAEDIHYKDFFDPAEGVPESQDLPEASGTALHPRMQKAAEGKFTALHQQTRMCNAHAEKPDGTGQE